MVEQNTSLATAAIGFYMMWAFFPALAFIVVLAASLLDKAQVIGWLSSVRLDLPDSFVLAEIQADADAGVSRSPVTRDVILISSPASPLKRVA